MPEIRDIISSFVERELEKCMDRVEEEAKKLMTQGYTLEELTVVIDQNGHRRVRPIEEIE